MKTIKDHHFFLIKLQVSNLRVHPFSRTNYWFIFKPFSKFLEGIYSGKYGEYFSCWEFELKTIESGIRWGRRRWRAIFWKSVKKLSYILIVELVSRMSNVSGWLKCVLVREGARVRIPTPPFGSSLLFLSVLLVFIILIHFFSIYILFCLLKTLKNQKI